MNTYKIEWIVTDEIEAVDKEHAEATFWYRLSCNCYDGDLKIKKKKENKNVPQSKKR